MPSSYALGQDEALSQVHAALRQGEMFFACLDERHLRPFSRCRDFLPGHTVAFQVSWHPS